MFWLIKKSHMARKLVVPDNAGSWLSVKPLALNQNGLWLFCPIMTLIGRFSLLSDQQNGKIVDGMSLFPLFAAERWLDWF